MHEESATLKRLYVLPEEITFVLSLTVGSSTIAEETKLAMKANYSVTNEFINYTGQQIRVVGQDNLDILLEPIMRPRKIDSGVMVKTTYTAMHDHAKIDPKHRTNSPTNEFEQVIGEELRKEEERKSRTITREGHTRITIYHLLPVDKFDDTGIIYDVKTNCVFSTDTTRRIIHPNSPEVRDIREQLNLSKEHDDGTAQIKYVLIDNSQMRSCIYINTGHNVICVSSKTDPNRESGLYVYSKGACSESRVRASKTSVVKFDIDTILSEKLFAFSTYAEAEAVGNMDERAKERERKAQQDYAQEERMFKHMEANGKREDRMREEKHKRLSDGIKLVTGMVSLVGVIAAAVIKAKKS